MDAIVAISTATGNGGIGIIRMSGKDCFTILNKIFHPVQKSDEIKGYTMKYGKIIDPQTKQVLDEVLVSYFVAPCSYTTENMCEINSHGGMVVEKRILEECLKNGAILAQPGEFTKRAFLNGRIDLSQAESIMDLIQSKTEKEAKASISQLEGTLSRKITNIQEVLLDIMADIEASIDYPEYDVEETTNEKILKTMQSVKEQLQILEKSFERGKILKEGIKTAIIGRPNAGKSSLLNILLREERAIVSDIEGTTRDTIEECLEIEGIMLKIVDTAGIRQTKDEIEQIGVERAWKIAEEADLILAIFDRSKELEKEDLEILELIKNKPAIILLNKCDLSGFDVQDNIHIVQTQKTVINVSMRTEEGMEKLYQEIISMFSAKEIELNDGEVITNIRHKNHIHLAIENVKEVEKTVMEEMPVDVVSIYMKQILEELGYITGQNVSEDIINEIFSKFCLGK